MFESFKEIHKSYMEMERTVEVVKQYELELLEVFTQFQEVVVLGCGSNYWASMTVARSLSNRTVKHATALKAAEVVMAPSEYGKFKTPPLILALSRSGESKDLLIAISTLKEVYPDSKLISFTEYKDSSLSKLSDIEINLAFANEVSVCQTRSFNCMLVAGLVLTSVIERNEKLIDDLSKYIKSSPNIYSEIEQFAKRIVHSNMEIVVLGTGVQYGAVIEGAYIVMEMAQSRTNYFQTLEYRHGPIVTANENTVVFICESSTENFELELNMGTEIKRTGAKVYLVGPISSNVLDGNLVIPKFSEEVRAIHFTTLLQSVAYHLAIVNNENPDKPGDLVRYIVY